MLIQVKDAEANEREKTLMVNKVRDAEPSEKKGTLNQVNKVRCSE